MAINSCNRRKPSNNSCPKQSCIHNFKQRLPPRGSSPFKPGVQSTDSENGGKWVSVFREYSKRSGNNSNGRIQQGNPGPNKPISESLIQMLLLSGFAIKLCSTIGQTGRTQLSKNSTIAKTSSGRVSMRKANLRRGRKQKAEEMSQSGPCAKM